MRLMIAVIAAATMLGGCASPPNTTDADPVPKGRLTAMQGKGEPHMAEITVMREWGFAGGGCYFGIYIDGMLVARMDANEKATFYVKPGRRLVGVGTDPQGAGTCGAGDRKYKREVATWIQSDEQQMFRVSLNPGVDIRPSSY